MSEKEKQKPGPKPDREDTLEKALKKKRPEDEWPHDGDEDRWEDEGGASEPESSD